MNICPASTLKVETKSSATERKPKLLDQLRQALRSRHYSRRTEETYCLWIKRYCQFHHLRHPAEMGEMEINAFLTHLAVKEKVSASTQNQALSALLFLYRHVIGREVGDLGEVIRARKHKHLPVVMTRNEVKAVLSHLSGDKWLIVAMDSLRLPLNLPLSAQCGQGKERVMKTMGVNKALRRMIFKAVPLLAIFVVMLSFFSCVIIKKEKQNSERKVEERSSANIKSQSISYGMVTSKVKKGITTQQEILELFGAPNITTITSEGEESWVYEYTSTSSETKETGISEAKQFDLFFGLGLYEWSSGEEEKKITVERSIKTLTVIIKFNKEKIVVDYSARATYF